jgi:hypothetical protein
MNPTQQESSIQHTRNHQSNTLEVINPNTSGDINPTHQKLSIQQTMSYQSNTSEVINPRAQDS